MNGSGKNLEDQHCYGDSWNVRFNFFCKKRGIEIIENVERVRGENAKKRI